MKRNKILGIIAIILFIVLLVIVGICLNKLNTQIIEEHQFYQYFVGQKVTYEGGLKLSRKKDITELTITDAQIELDSTPAYYTDIENKVIFPEDMIIVFPNQAGIMYKINHFSNIFFDTETAYLEGKTENRVLNHAFLYDGQDLYFFLENITLKVGEQEYELSPLSYVKCNQDTLEIYQKTEDNYIILEEKPEEIIATTEDYKINLNIDSIKGKDTEQLLIKNKEILKNF